VEGRRLPSTIRGSNADRDIVGSSLGIFDLDIEVAVFVEDASIEELEFRLLAAAAATLFDEPLVGEGSLWVLVDNNTTP
jgi:hypothetical protein